jgi:hypothetical protein
VFTGDRAGGGLRSRPGGGFGEALWPSHSDRVGDRPWRSLGELEFGPGMSAARPAVPSGDVRGGLFADGFGIANRKALRAVLT